MAVDGLILFLCEVHRAEVFVMYFRAKYDDDVTLWYLPNLSESVRTRKYRYGVGN